MPALKIFDGSDWQTVGALSGSTVPSVDDVPASPNAADYEFSAASSSLPAGWSWFNQGTSTYDEAAGAGRLVLQDGAGINRGIVQSIPAAGTWTLTAKVSSIAVNGTVGIVGICLRTAGDTKMSTVGWDNTGRLVGYRHTGDSYVSDIITAITTPDGGPFNGQYLRLVKSSSTSFAWWVSRDGRAFVPVVTGYNPTAHHTPDQVGVLVRVGTSVQTAIHWWRVV